MKLRTSYFDGTILKKNVTRFAPVWGLYSAAVLVVFIMSIDWRQWHPQNASSMAGFVTLMAAINLFYAFAVAQLIWGDLFNSRMCNALHALPLRRETWFVTNAVSGFLFSFVPNAAFSLCMIPVCGELWPVAPLWLGAVTLQYICFFGLATLSAFLVGSRFAMGVIYGIFTFFAGFVHFLLSELYLPTMNGIVLRDEHFNVFMPLIRMIEYADMIWVDWDSTHDGVFYNVTWNLDEGWGYTAICAGVGILALGLALLFYRKRHLECAGDFVAVKPLAPVVLVIYTLCVAAFFCMIVADSSELYILMGLAIGFFTGKMLLERQVRVFRRKNLLAFCAVVLVFFGSLAAAAYDVLGIVKWMPNAERVAAVSVTTGGTYYYQDNGTTLEDQEDIEKILYLHQEGLNHYQWATEGTVVRMQLTYEMDSGIRRSREYNILVSSEAGQILKTYLSSQEAVLGELELLEGLASVEFHDPGTEITDAADLETLLAAIAADCEAGVMAQDRRFYSYDEIHYMSLRFKTPDGIHYYKDLQFWEGCENIMAWVQAQGIQFEKWN